MEKGAVCSWNVNLFLEKTRKEIPLNSLHVICIRMHSFLWASTTIRPNMSYNRAEFVTLCFSHPRTATQRLRPFLSLLAKQTITRTFCVRSSRNKLAKKSYFKCHEAQAVIKLRKPWTELSLLLHFAGQSSKHGQSWLVLFFYSTSLFRRKRNAGRNTLTPRGRDDYSIY